MVGVSLQYERYLKIPHLLQTGADIKAEVYPELRQDLGEELFAARYRGETVSLRFSCRVATLIRT